MRHRYEDQGRQTATPAGPCQPVSQASKTALRRSSAFPRIICIRKRCTAQAADNFNGQPTRNGDRQPPGSAPDALQSLSGFRGKVLISWSRAPGLVKRCGVACASVDLTPRARQLPDLSPAGAAGGDYRGLIQSMLVLLPASRWITRTCCWVQRVMQRRRRGKATDLGRWR